MTRRVSRLRPAPPEPTLDDPYAQLDWLAQQYVSRYTNKNTRTHILRVVASLKKYYEETHGYDARLVVDPRFYLTKHFDQFTLHRLHLYLQSLGLSSHTVATRVRVIRRVLNYAAAKNYTPKKVFSITMRQGKRETKQREAYEDAELGFIRDVISHEVLYVNRILAGYKLQRVGADPRRQRRGRKPRSSGWRVWENMVWYFENELDCKPFGAAPDIKKKHKSFYNAAIQYFGGVRRVWRRLGVCLLIDSDLIIPLAIKLAWETGLSPESVLSLRRDCWHNSHPLTGQPYLTYHKKRSKGNKELHLPLLDSDRELSELSLLAKQSTIIGRTIDLICRVTAPLTTAARKEDQGYLFLKQNHGGGLARTGGVVRLNYGHMPNWSNKIVKEYLASDTKSAPTSFNLARFRPTKITQMVRDGYDFFAIQAAAGHTDAKTTWNYLNTHQLNPVAEREVTQTLIRIHRNSKELERDPKPYANAESNGTDAVIYKGVIADCKNVFEPPSWIKRLPGYKPGQSCTLWNMCLLCPNVLITRKHLPRLVAYDSEIEFAIERNNLSNAPNALHYQKTRAVIAGIYEDFGEEDVRHARAIAEQADYHLDAVTYRGVNQP